MPWEYGEGKIETKGYGKVFIKLGFELDLTELVTLIGRF